ncbi:MAG: Gfo/Idh/MocA family oxidoreductase, partial [Planctomycetota bacterium]|nr:Gfo/Idh/MocA family oxidoreductase [Planctomycetota bacterium]
MSNDRIRVGIIGAGANTKLRHIPGFRAVRNVDILGVVNRSRESSTRIADEYDIPRTYDDWTHLLADPDIDAIQIGTWPDMHCIV